MVPYAHRDGDGHDAGADQRPDHWRQRADEARAIAEEMADPQAKRSMLMVADGYEKIAQRAEERSLSEPAKPGDGAPATRAEGPRSS